MNNAAQRAVERSFDGKSAAPPYHILLHFVAPWLNNDGTFQWVPPSTLVSSVNSGKSRLTVAGTLDEAVLAVWSDTRTDANDVYGQRVAPDGSLGGNSILGYVDDLRIGRVALTPGDLHLSWGQTCGLGQDHGIYQGTIGGWYDHLRLDCADAGNDLTEQITPGSGDRYYLVVPLGGTEEGSYGTDSDGTERPRGTAGLGVCRLGQSVVTCP